MTEWLRDFWARSLAIFYRTRRDQDFDEELAAHIAIATDEAVARGARPDEARRLALAKFGGLDAAREIHRDARGWPLLESVVRDVQRAIRLLRRSPIVTAAAVTSLALGMGGVTTMFSILNGLVLRPLPVRAPGQLVALVAGDEYANWKLPVWEQMRDRTDLFDGIFAWELTTLDLAERGESRPVTAYLVSGAFFDVLGVVPRLGRLLSAADDLGAGQDGRVAVISEAFWRRQFGGAPSVIGTPLQLNGATLRIVGVMPESFFGLEVGRSIDVVVPLADARLLGPDNSRSNVWLSVMARLKQGQNATAAGAALRAAMPGILTVAGPAMAAIYMPLESHAMFKVARVEPAPAGLSSLRDQFERPIVTVTAIAVVVLMIACLNIANLLHARGDTRRHEFALAMALGATRTRLIRQLVIESLVLSAVGATLGIGIAAWAGPILVHEFASPHQNIVLALPIDWRLLSITGVAAVLTAVLFGTAPALRATSLSPNSALSKSTRMIHGHSAGRIGVSLVALQVALSLVLTISAALLVGTFIRLDRHDLGFDPVAVLALNVKQKASTTTHATNEARRRRILDAVEGTPGVAAAAFSNIVPLTVGRMTGVLTSPDGSAPQMEREVFAASVTPGWLRTIGIRLVKGRDYSWDDERAGKAIIVNEALARAFFGTRDPIGLTLRARYEGTYTVIGVAGDAVYRSAREGAPPTAYLLSAAGYGTLFVRSATGQLNVLTRRVLETIARTDPDVVVGPTPLSDNARATIARERVTAILAGFFGALAFLLSAVGVCGVMAYSVNCRRTEIAVRRALGATTADITGQVVGRGFRAVVIGVAAGTVASLWASALIAPLLYGVGSHDVRTFAGAAAALGIVSVAAAWIPARRAANLDPAIVLRES
jgi:predicted permease